MGDFFRSFFGPKKFSSKIKPRMQSKRLELIGLEERITPIAESLVFSGGNLVFVNPSSLDNTLTVSSSGQVLTFSSTADLLVSPSVGKYTQVSANSVTVDITQQTGSEGVAVSYAGLTNVVLEGSNHIFEQATRSILQVNSTGLNLSVLTTPTGNVGTIFRDGTLLFETDVNIAGPVITKGGNFTIDVLTNSSSDIITTVLGDITASTGQVLFLAPTISTAGDVTTTTGNITIGNATLGGNVTITSTSGNLVMETIAGASNNLTISEGSGTVSLGNITGLGNLNISTTNATFAAIDLVAVAAGAVRLNAVGDIEVTGVVTAASVNARSTTGDVIFSGAVTTDGANGFTSEASLATKATKIAADITVYNGANLLLNGNVIASGNILLLSTTLTGNLTITGKLDSASLSDRVELQASQGTITLEGPVGSTTMGDLGLFGLNSFVAHNTVVTTNLYSETKGSRDLFAGSVTFSKAVTVSGIYGVNFTTQGFGTLSFLDSITLTNPTGYVLLDSNFGAINVAGAITCKDDVDIASTSGLITLGAISTDQADGDISIINASGNIATSGKISTLGNTAGIILQTTSGNITTSGEITTSGNGPFFNPSIPSIRILTGANGLATLNSPIYTTGNRAPIIISVSSAIINAPLTTSGPTEAGGIALEVNGGTMVVNQSITAGVGGGVQLGVSLATDVITIAKTAPISSGSAVISFGAGTINLGASITAVGDPGNGYGINFSYVNTILTNDVSLKTTGPGSGSAIYLNGAMDGFYSLTLETPGDTNSSINITNLGQTTPLNTVTVTNSAGVIVSGNFTAAKVVLSDTTGSIAFNGNTNITSSLTTAANPYNIDFGNGASDTTVLAGAPVFLNTGDVSFSGITSLTSGATITGGAATVVTLAGTLVSGGSFNIGALPARTSISNGTILNLTSTLNESTFAGKVVLASSNTLTLNGLGTLTLSGDSSDPMHVDGFVGTANVITGTLNVTGSLCGLSRIQLTSGTLTGNGQLGSVISSASSTVAPSGALTMDSFFQDASSVFKVSVYSPITASQIVLPISIPFINNSILRMSSVVSGLGMGNQLTIIDTAGLAPITGTFAGLPEGATISALDTLGNTITFAISYVGGTGNNDVTLTVTNVSIANPSAIPQPMVAGQPLLNFLTAVGAGAGGGPMVTVTLDILPGLTTVPTYFSFFAYDVGFTGGVRVALNELDGNTDTREIITGPGPGGGPNVKVFQFNMRTLIFNPTPVASFFAFNDPNFSGGVYVAGGDVTGDGIGDLLVGAGASGGPRVQVYAGSFNGVITSAPISDFFAYSTEFLGGVVVAAGDRTGDSTLEVITGPASNGGYNIKSFNITGTGNGPTLIENFFAFNDFTSIGGLSIATVIFDANPMDDLVIGTTNTQFGIILNQNYAGIQANPFPGFTGAIRAGFAYDQVSNIYQALAAAGPGGGPRVSIFSVDPINRTLTQTDSLFVFDPAFTGGLFVAN